MPDPITTEELYGSSAMANPPPPPSPSTPPLPVEETPEIPMDIPVQQAVPPPPPMPKTPRRSTFLMIIVLIILFVAGILLSNIIRPFVSGIQKEMTQIPTPTTIAVTPTPADPLALWKTVSISGVSYKLPPDVLTPICDGTGCVSQGTYLPGGTRLTISPKTVTQSLSSLRGAIITDVTGTAFTSRDATMSGRTAIEFSGTFAGTTSGGYGFSQMHGFMIEVSPTMTLEMNHFTPTGISTDWAEDDALFTQIISTMDFLSTPSATMTQ